MSTAGSLGVVGAGAIGAGWTALGLRHGRRVVVTDPARDAADRLRAAVTTLLQDSPVDLGEQLEFTDDLAEVAAADLVFEAGPERIDLKRDLFARLDAEAPPTTLLTSSSSGLSATEIQRDCARHPERVLVAHPFNPPHLVPLVEVVGGRLTSEDAVRRTIALLRGLGKEPIRVRAELPGHVANRLQAALWREAYSLVDRGVVSVADLDTAIAHGPGLRWALLGPFATQHLSGGGGGLAHVLAHLGPPMVEWWRDLGDPELSDDLVARLVAGVTDELAGIDETDLIARRDRALVDLLALKAGAGLGPDGGGEVDADGTEGTADA